MVVTAADATTTSIPGAVSSSDTAGAFAGATKVTFRWRYDSKPGTKTVDLAAGPLAALEFHRTLQQAIAQDWLADSKRRPIVPGQMESGTDAPTGAVKASPADPMVGGVADGGVVVALVQPATASPRSTSGIGLAEVVRLGVAADDRKSDHPDALVLPTAREDDWGDLYDEIVPLADVGALVAWRLGDMATTMSKRGHKRAGSTRGNARGELNLAADTLRYQPGDDRLGCDGIEVGASLRLDHPGGTSESDLLALIDFRKNLNLKVRSTNQKSARRWAARVEKVDRLADRQLIEALTPPPLAPEVASARTVQATCNQLAAALRDAHAEGRISSNPWTARVNRHIERVPQPHFSERLLFGDDNVARITDGLAVMAVADKTGERYVGLVQCAFDAYLRPEELMAARLSWLNLGDNPAITVHGGEVFYSACDTDGAGGRTSVDLKWRGQGETRRVPISTDASARLKAHVAEFVPEPDPTSGDPDRRDPRLFTTHTGAPLDRRNFSRTWWRPLVETVFASPGEAHLAELDFRHLRHSGITAALLSGLGYDEVARRAGNSPLVIYRHYRGVIDQSTDNRDPVHTGASGSSLESLAAELVRLPEDQAADRLAAQVENVATPALVQLAGAFKTNALRRMEEM